MVREIYKDIFLIEIPLPNNPLKNLNSYLVKGKYRHLLIDTGFNRADCYEAMVSGLRKIAVDMNFTDIFLTHHHADHSGLCQRIASNSSKIFISEADKTALLKMTDGSIAEIMGEKIQLYGMPDDVFGEHICKSPIIKYAPKGQKEYTTVGEGHIFSVGSYKLEAIGTPGHTSGHLCLYERHHQVLFCGDHIIFGITPNISMWTESMDSLGHYLNSLKRIRALDVNVAFSAHRTAVVNCTQRIDELLTHHDKRIQQTNDIVNAFPGSNTYEIASRMKWSIRGGRWNEFPFMQKWFAADETASHLEYIAVRQRLTRTIQDGCYVYYP